MDIINKICICCHKSKILEDFYKHPQMKDGHLGRCKECQKNNSSYNYFLHRDEHIIYEQMRGQKPERKLKKLLYQRKSRAINQLAYKATGIVNNAIRDEKLQKESCMLCGSVKAEAHHADYGKPLEVTWLCRPCHVSLHGKIPF